jgi:hypothetical protein
MREMARFSVDYTITGRMNEIIEAESEDAAREIAQANAENEDWFPDLDSIDDVNFHMSRLHRVQRDGVTLSTTYVRPTDVRLDD